MANKLIKQRDRNRVLKNVAYLAAFPLFIIVVFLGSIPFMHANGFGSTKYYGVLVAIAAWLAVTVFQIVISIFTRNFTARAVIMVILTLIVMVGGSVFFDFWATKKVDAAREAYARDVYSIDESVELTLTNDKVSYVVGEGDKAKTITLAMPMRNFKNQVNSYSPWTSKSGLADEFSGAVSEMCRVYNIGYTSEVKGSVNTDGSKYGKARTVTDADGNEVLEYWFGEKGDVYKENGLYADGYIFSVPVALEILITYYETQNYYAEQGKDADALLDAALIKASASSEYKAYKRTDEYKEAYEGKNAKVASYKITEERLDAMVKALGQGLYDTGLHSTVNTIARFAAGITLSDKQYKNLSVDELLSIAKGLGIDLDKESVMEVLAPFSNYEYSNVLPVMNFIEDETLRTYAYAKYFGETHGANVGSALIPSVKKDATGKKEYGKIGHITMSTSGLSYEENAFTLEESYLLRAQCGYAPTMFPLFAARRYAYIFAGIIALMYALFYYAKMKVYCKGKKIEKFCIKGGAM